MDELTGTTRATEALPARTVSQVRPAVRGALEGAGFHALDIGDGCLAWCRSLHDETHVLVSANNALDADPEAAEWIAGRYSDTGGFIEVNGLTLPQALDAAAVLPVPVRADGSLVEALYPSLEQAMDDFA